MPLTDEFLAELTHTLARANADATVALTIADLRGSITHTKSVRPAELVAAARTLLETAEDMLDETATTRDDIRALEDARAALEYLPRREDEDDEDGDDAGDAA